MDTSMKCINDYMNLNCRILLLVVYITSTAGYALFDAALARALAYALFNDTGALCEQLSTFSHRLKRHPPHTKEQGACKKLCRTPLSIYRHTPYSY